jgi:hypothetical protein
VYRIEVKAEGFKAQAIRELRLAVAETIVQDVEARGGQPGRGKSRSSPRHRSFTSSTTSVGQVINERTVRKSR